MEDIKNTRWIKRIFENSERNDYKMDFSKLFLGYNEINEFIKLAIREEYITDYLDDYRFDDNFCNEIIKARASKVNYKSTLLRLVLLYDNIDANRLMGYNVDRLIDIGLVSKDSVLNGISAGGCSAERVIQKNLKLLDIEKPQFESLIVELILKLNKNCGINFFDYLPYDEIKNMSFIISQGNIRKLEKFLFNSVFFEILAECIVETEWFKRLLFENDDISLDKLINRIAKEKISQYFLEPIKNIMLQNETEKISDNIQIVESFSLLDDLYTINGKKQCKTCKYCKTIECLGEFECEYAMGRYVTLLDVFTSINQKVPVYSRYFKTNFMDTITNAKIVNDVYYLFKLPELKQLNSLPSPQSLAEALRLRNRPEIISFRNIFRSWCEELQKFGDIKTIELITKDFNKASNYLNEQYKKNEEQKRISNALLQNLISILMLVPGYFLPFFSLLFDIPEPWISRKDAIKRSETEWFLLTR